MHVGRHSYREGRHRELSFNYVDLYVLPANRIVLSTKKGWLLGFQAIYQHLVEKHRTMTSPMIKGNAVVEPEDCCKDVVNFDEGEYVILVAGTFNKQISISILIQTVARLYIVTSEGKYLEIGAKAKGAGQDFEWKFTKERYFFALKATAKEYISYLNPLYLSSDLLHFKPKERMPRKVDLSKDLIVQPSTLCSSHG
ncbi:MAG: hypothetical protein P4M11_10435 [Candidatus Pacebacteria bacterium]|nr:hypothetical protein [Candidatus Paceibacterota bacterium]